MATSSNPKRGFTLVEVLIAITLVNVMVVLFCRMFIAQNSLVDSIEDWCASDPVYYVQPAASPVARSVAAPADLSATIPGITILGKVVKPYDVSVLQLDRDLAAMESRATVLLTDSEDG